MNHCVRTLALATVIVSAVFLTACSSGDSIVDTKQKQTVLEQARAAIEAKSGPELANAYVNHAVKGASTQAAITYIGEVCNTTVGGTATRYSIYNADNWSYYKFYGVAGDAVSVTVNRDGCGIDPAFELRQGTATSTTDYYGLPWLAWQDDNISVGCGCSSDPTLIGYSLPATGWYTVAVFDYHGCGDPITFNLTVSGATCDSDGDGVYDDTDPYPNSDTQDNIVIDGCDSGVGNQYLGNGTYMMDKILDCKNTAANHGAFVSCLNQLANGWKTAGLISGAQKGAITACGAQSNWP